MAVTTSAPSGEDPQAVPESGPATAAERRITAALNVLRVLDRAESTGAEVAEAAEADPDLGKQILRMARSPLCGVRTPDLTVARAIVLLGFLSIRKLVVVSLCRDMAESDRTDTDQWLRALWVGICSEELAKRVDESLVREALMVGMMRTIAISYPGGSGEPVEPDEDERFGRLLAAAEALATVIIAARPGLPSTREVDDALEGAGLYRLEEGKLAVDVRRGFELYSSLLA